MLPTVGQQESPFLEKREEGLALSGQAERDGVQLHHTDSLLRFRVRAVSTSWSVWFGQFQP